MLVTNVFAAITDYKREKEVETLNEREDRVGYLKPYCQSHRIRAGTVQCSWLSWPIMGLLILYQTVDRKHLGPEAWEWHAGRGPAPNQHYTSSAQLEGIYMCVYLWPNSQPACMGCAVCKQTCFPSPAQRRGIGEKLFPSSQGKLVAVPIQSQLNASSYIQTHY